MTAPWLGAVADDITGACDLADALCAAGSSAIVQCGVPDADPLPACDSAVVALKSRTAPVGRAVTESRAAARRLLDAGCAVLYQKYCSTFDSTDAGNIGPVADALRPLVGDDSLSVGTPATPRAGRTVYQGHLFVGRQLLSESSLRHHPLTPMRDSDLVAVLSRQTPHEVGLIPRAVVSGGAGAVGAAIRAAIAAGGAHLVVDALDEADLDAVATALLEVIDAGSGVLVGGAAGLGAALARARARGGAPADPRAARALPRVPAGRRLILSGSCSARTREQVAHFPRPALQLSPAELAGDADRTVDALLRAVQQAYAHGDDPVLVSSSAEPDRVRAVESELGPGRAAELLEAAMGEIARRAVDTLGVRRILVAGGETSGAVVAALGARTLRVGPAAAPGVPWMVPAGGPALALLLKSGNFGAPDLFTSAWDVGP